jgi:hypothetical protein
VAVITEESVEVVCLRRLSAPRETSDTSLNRGLVWQAAYWRQNTYI